MPIVPSAIQAAEKNKKLLLLVAAYFLVGFLILYFFFEPKTPSAIMAIAGVSILWNIY